MSNEWEVVIKGGKHKSQQQLSKQQLKKIAQSNLNNNKYRLAIDEDTDKSLSPEQNKVSNKVKPKKGNTIKVEDDINRQINKISSESVKSIYKELTEKFPNQTTISLLDLAVHLSLMVKVSDDIMKTINFDQIDFPYALLSSDTQTAFRGIFSGLSNSHISNFLKSAMIQLLDDYDKGVHSIGLRIMIQACVRMKSIVFITNRKNFFDLFNLHRENTTKFKLLTWVLRQACSNYNMACQIWLIYFLPFITQKCHTEFVISFGEEIKDYPIDTTGNDTSLLVADFVPIIDLIFTQNFNNQHTNDKKAKKKQTNFQLTSIQIDRLKAIYLKIKDQAFLSKSPGALKDYFASLFLRLSPNNKNANLNMELLNCLEHCVKTSPDSVSQLNHLHLEYPQQTKVFLDYLSNENSSAAQSIKKSKLFKSLMDKIHSNHLAAPIGSVQDNLRQLTETCKSSNSNFMSCFGFFFRLLTYIVLVGFIIGGILWYQYPQQYKLIHKQVTPYVEYIAEKLTPTYKYYEHQVLEAYQYAHPAILNGYNKMWAYLTPFLKNLGAKIDYLSIYLRSKLDEVFPQLINQIGEVLQSLKHYMTQLVNYIEEKINSDDFQGWMKFVSERSFYFMRQIESGYQSIVSYTMKMMGY